MNPETIVAVVGLSVVWVATAGVQYQRIRTLEDRENERVQDQKEVRRRWRQRMAKLENRVRDLELWKAAHEYNCKLKRDR